MYLFLEMTIFGITILYTCQGECQYEQMNAETSYTDLIHQQGVHTSQLLQVDSLLAVEWIKVGDKWLLLYIMI